MAANREVVAEWQCVCEIVAEAALNAWRCHEVRCPALAKSELTRERRRVLPTATRQVANIACHRQAILERRRHRRVPEGELARLCTRSRGYGHEDGCWLETQIIFLKINLFVERTCRNYARKDFKWIDIFHSQTARIPFNYKTQAVSLVNLQYN